MKHACGKWLILYHPNPINRDYALTGPCYRTQIRLNSKHKTCIHIHMLYTRHVYMYTSIYICRHMYTFVCIHVYIYMCAYKYKGILMQIHINTHIQTHTHIQVHIHIHNAQEQGWARLAGPARCGRRLEVVK